MSSVLPGSPKSTGNSGLVTQLQAENERLKADLARVMQDVYCQDKAQRLGKPLFTIVTHKHHAQATAADASSSSSSSSSTASENLKAPAAVAAVAASTGRISSSTSFGALSPPSPPAVVGSPSLSVGMSCVGVVVLGASGDLALKKTYPALYSLYLHELLPKDFFIVGYARSQIDLNDFRKKIGGKFAKSTDEQKNTFLSHCYYVSGQYDKLADFAKLNEEINKLEIANGAKARNRVFYFAIPPNIFFDVAKGIAGAAMSSYGWNRVIVEKPFGRDSDSSALLNRQIMSLFTEDQIYRIDHYLGKEMVQNLMVLRFANKVFEPLWNHNHIQCVMITFKEDFGTQGRGGYFDNFGIIRDVMQNHLFQILSLVGMNAPVTLNAEDVRDEKVKLLRAIKPLQLEDLVIGQYEADPKGKESSYLQDPTVPKNSITPTFAQAVFHIHNERWAGTPFILKCGKALNERKAEIRVQFRQPLNNLFEDLSNNELVLRVQPDEAVYLKMSAKKPGLQGGMTHTELDLSYKSRFVEAKSLPDAYERLIYDVVRGDHNLFVRADELAAAWAIFTPVLNRLEREKIKPLPYEYGSRGPKEADDLAYKYGFNRTVNYRWLDAPLK